MNFLLYLCIILFILISLLLVLIILIQKGRGGGLATAFGGAGGNTAFGAKTGDVLTWTTSIIFGVFIVLAIGLNLLANYRHEQTLREAGVGQPVAPMMPTSDSTPATADPGAAGTGSTGAGEAPAAPPESTPAQPE